MFKNRKYYGVLDHSQDMGTTCGNPSSIGGLADRRQQPVQSNRTFRFLEKPKRFESIRIANRNALVLGRCGIAMRTQEVKYFMNVAIGTRGVL